MAHPTPDHLERIRAEATTVDDGDVAVIATDAHGTIVYWNDPAAALYGWDARDVLGRNILEVTPTRNSSDEAGSIMEELRRGKSWTGPFIVRRRDGKPLIARVTNVPVRERGEVIGVIGISRASGPAVP